MLFLPDIAGQALEFGKVFERYQEAVSNESTVLATELKSTVNPRVLDIGCGIAGYHTEWLRSREDEFHLFLMDSSKFDFKSLLYGYGDKNRYYNSLRLALSYISHHTLNFNSRKFSCLDTQNMGEIPQDLNLVCSFLSWGFHYPLGVYWEEVTRKIVKGGKLIIDVRSNSKDEEFVKSQGLYAVEKFSDLNGSKRYYLVRL